MRDRQLRVLIRASHEGSRRAYGSPRVLEDLIELGIPISRKRVARLMQAESLRARVRKRFRSTTMSDHDQPIAANVLDRQFAAEWPNQRWVGDTTEFGSQALFGSHHGPPFAVHRGLGTERSDNDRHLTLSALDKAVKRRCPDAGLLHHSDQGCTYASEDYRTRLDAHGITCGMSRRGNCYDNVVMESWFSTVRAKRASALKVTPIEEALFDYIEVFYNQRRRQSTLGPNQPSGIRTTIDSRTVANPSTRSDQAHTTTSMP